MGAQQCPRSHPQLQLSSPNDWGGFVLTSVQKEYSRTSQPDRPGVTQSLSFDYVISPGKYRPPKAGLPGMTPMMDKLKAGMDKFIWIHSLAVPSYNANPFSIVKKGRSFI